MENNIHRLLTDGYERPKKTYTDTIQNQNEIEKQLENFEEIEEKDIDKTPLNCYLKYIKFDLNNNSERLITGGILLRIDPNYLLLKGKNNGTFCAQRYTKKGTGSKQKLIHTTRFFKQLSSEDKLKADLVYFQEKATKIINEYEQTVRKQQSEINELKRIIKKNRNK